MAYVELGQDNGGILLNLGEGGFAVQSALALTSREFPELRFQVPAAQGWLTAGGRIVWISDSNKEAGIQFTELPGEARRVIQRWVSAEGEPQKGAERAPVRSNENSPKQRLETPYSAGGAVREDVGNSAHSNSVQAERERGPAMQREAGAIAVAEAPPQDFHFTDYSMFAAAPERAGVWAEPRHQGSWRRGALGVLVAVLFFALGATVGREAIERWIADIGGWAQNELAPASKITPPTPQAAPAEAADGNSEAKSATGEDHAKAEDNVNPKSESAADSTPGKITSEEKKSVDVPQNNAETAKTGPVSESVNTPGAKPRNEAAAGGPKRFTESVAPRDKRVTEVAPSGMAEEHSILVNAPDPGSPPFFVNLPGEAISASGAIAISARRTLEVLPRGAGYSRSERVVIGKLISHGEPFYPVEARNHHIEGNVELRARVGRTGQIISVTPVSGPRLLSSAAMTAVREWRYEPTFVDGDPAETLADITVVFRLR
jgi:TonB family protein